MFYGILDLSWWQMLLVGGILTHITIVSVTLFLHRSQAHRAVIFHPIMNHFFRLWLWLTTGQETKAWVSIHRKHHAKCETEEDPHSPVVLGLSKVLWEGAELYRRESKNTETLQRYGHGTPDDWLERNLYEKYSAKGVFLTLLVNIVLFGVPGITLWAIQMAWIPFFAAGIINGVGHFFGYRNVECPDAATKIVPWGMLIGGEELHNNHHVYPTSARFSIKWWEFDIGWLYIKALSALGLATVKREPPVVALSENKTIDPETVRALITNRFHVMTCYTKMVILPAFKQEKAKANVASRQMLKKIKQALVREQTLVKPQEQDVLESTLAKHEALERLYELRCALQAIWDRTTATPKELVEALQAWCKEAEASGIKSLEAFAEYLRGYAVVAA